jgi:hypothetical protein
VTRPKLVADRATAGGPCSGATSQAVAGGIGAAMQALHHTLLTGGGGGTRMRLGSTLKLGFNQHET